MQSAFSSCQLLLCLHWYSMLLMKVAVLSPAIDSRGWLVASHLLIARFMPGSIIHFSELLSKSFFSALLWTVTQQISVVSVWGGYCYLLRRLHLADQQLPVSIREDMFLFAYGDCRPAEVYLIAVSREKEHVQDACTPTWLTTNTTSSFAFF